MDNQNTEPKQKKNYPIVLLPEERKIMVRALASALFPQHVEALEGKDTDMALKLLERLDVTIKSERTPGKESVFTFIDTWGR